MCRTFLYSLSMGELNEVKERCIACDRIGY